MPIRIIKKPAQAAPEPAALVPDAEVATPISEMTDEQRLAKWKDFPPPNAKPTPCPYCGRELIGHCTPAGWSKCPNFMKRNVKL